MSTTQDRQHNTKSRNNNVPGIMTVGEGVAAENPQLPDAIFKTYHCGSNPTSDHAHAWRMSKQSIYNGSKSENTSKGNGLVT